RSRPSSAISARAACASSTLRRNNRPASSPRCPAPEAIEGCLVARRRRDHGARAEERQVSGLDLLGSVHQQPRRPQRVREIMPARLKLSRQTTIRDQRSAVRFEEAHKVTLSPDRLPLVPRQRSPTGYPSLAL